MTEKKFKEYVKIQRSGRTNMFDVSTVVALSRGVLDKEDCFDIMKHYFEYSEQWPNVATLK